MRPALTRSCALLPFALLALTSSASAQTPRRPRPAERPDAGNARMNAINPAAFREPPSMQSQTVGVGAASEADEPPSSEALRGATAPAPDQITGPIGPGDAARVIQSQMPRLRPCYEHERETHPTLAGRVEVRVRIGPTGRVIQSAAVGMPEAPAVATCVAEALRQTVFPRPETAPLQIVYPISFAPPPRVRGANATRRPAATPPRR